MKIKLSLIALVPLLITIALPAFSNPSDQGHTADTLPPSEQKFHHKVVLDQARRLADAPFEQRQPPVSSSLRQLTYDEYRDIRFNSDWGVWRHEQVRFRIDLLAAGFIYEQPVAVSIVESGIARDMQVKPEMFTAGPRVENLPSTPLGLSGFRVRTRLNSPAVWDEFLVFQGASYFRAVSRGTLFGLSARGLTIRTAHPAGEEFPAFIHFWIERPSANAAGIVIHALLDSPSTTGAYRFSIIPGANTVIDVDLTLFPRVPLDHVGIAPLTSMFLFNASNRSRIDDFRDAVHDSDGLQVFSDHGEQIWRPLANPTQLQISTFTAKAPQAFGLVQRAREPTDYHDLEANYHQRPSAWVEPTGNWGAGAVNLVEIPTDNETNDNIVAFWKPDEVISSGKPWRIAYRLRWGPVPPVSPTVGRAIAMRSGPSLDGKRRLFVVEFDHTTSFSEDLKMEATTSAGELSNQVLQYNPLTRGVRASFELDPKNNTVAELFLRLTRDAKAVTETWLYRWTAD